VEELHRVVAVIDEVHAEACRDDRDPKEAAGTGRAPRAVQQFVGDLVAARGGFDDIAVVSVDRQDITVGRNGHAQRVVDGPIGCHILSREHGTLALERVRDCGDAVVQAIRDVGDHLIV